MKLVLCEGKDELAVLNGLCAASGIVGLQVEQIGGRDNLESTLREIPKRPEFTRGEVESVGIIIDADEDEQRAWRKLDHAVEMAFALKRSSGMEFGGSQPRVGGFVIADKTGRGMLESLCLEAVSGDPSFACLETYFQCLTEKFPGSAFHPKQRFNAWMASQTKENLRVGLAAGKGFLPWLNPAFDPLRSFLRGM